MEEESGAYFLDTSTQISKTWEDEEIRNCLNNELSHKPCYSSIYVKNEYKSNVVNDAILVYNATVDSSSLDDAKSRLDNLMKGIGRGIDELPYKILRRLFNQYNSPKPLLRKLEKIIELGWSNFFYGNIKKELFNLVRCKSAQDNHIKKGKLYIDITNKCPSDCNIRGFLNTRHSDLKLLKDIDTSKLDRATDPHGTLRGTQRVSKEILDGASPRGKRCKKISDSIISIEARDCYPGIILHSMDADFELLGEVLNIPTHVRTKHDILREEK